MDQLGLKERDQYGPVNFNPFEDEDEKEKDKRFVPTPDVVKADIPMGPVTFDPFAEKEEKPKEVPWREKRVPILGGTAEEAVSLPMGVMHGLQQLGVTAGTVTQWIGNRLDNKLLADMGKSIAGYYEKTAETYRPPSSIADKNLVDNPELLINPSYWIFNTADMAPSLAAAIIPGVGAANLIKVAGTRLALNPQLIARLAALGATVVGGTAGGVLEGSQTYQQVLKQGGSEEEAARAGELMTVAAGALNAVGINKILQSAGTTLKGRVLKHLGAGVWEGVTEGLEEPAEVVSKLMAKYLTGEEIPDKIGDMFLDSLKEAITVFPIAGITGAGASISMDISKKKATEDEILEIEDLREQPVDLVESNKETKILEKIKDDVKNRRISIDQLEMLRDEHFPGDSKVGLILDTIIARMGQLETAGTKEGLVPVGVTGELARKSAEESAGVLAETQPQFIPEEERIAEAPAMGLKLREQLAGEEALGEEAEAGFAPLPEEEIEPEEIEKPIKEIEVEEIKEPIKEKAKEVEEIPKEEEMAVAVGAEEIKKAPEKVEKGRDLFNKEQLAEFDRLKIDVSKVSEQYKAEALQQIKFKTKYEGLTSEEYNAKIREEYKRIEERRKEAKKPTPKAKEAWDREKYQKTLTKRQDALKEIDDELKANNYRLKKNYDYTITLYHGTSPEIASTIKKSGSLKGFTFLSHSKSKSAFGSEGAKGYGKEVLEIKIDPRDVNFNGGSGEFEAEYGLIRNKDTGIWESPQRLISEGKIKSHPDYPELGKGETGKAIKEWQDIKDLDAQIRTIKPPKKKGDNWEVDIGLQESLGEQGGDIVTWNYKEKPTLKDIQRDIVEEYKRTKKEINKEVSLGIKAKSGRDEMIEGAIDKVLKKEPTQETLIPKQEPKLELKGEEAPPKLRGRGFPKELEPLAKYAQAYETAEDFDSVASTQKAITFEGKPYTNIHLKGIGSTGIALENVHKAGFKDLKSFWEVAQKKKAVFPTEKVKTEVTGEQISLLPKREGEQVGLEEKVEEVKEEKVEKIEDFGEKIGGARKDTAERGFSVTEKPKATEAGEAWRKKYVAMEKVDGSGWTVGKKGDRFGISGRRTQVFATQEEAEKAIPIFAIAEKHHVYRDTDNKDEFAIYKTVGKRKRFKVVGKTFPSREEGMEYMAQHAEEILNIKTTFGEEILPVPEIATRTGKERRTTDATPEMFMETFAPRGIEFGNWNNQDERQQVLNHAYDGLLDLADVLEIPPKALMLDGDLGIAFGARGQGLSGAKAHYEPDYGVINLTKMKGAGSLAHEWFHALDHYLARQDTKASSEKETNKRGDLTYKTKSNRYSFQSYGKSYKSKVRPELQQAYDNIINTMYRKAKSYVEDTETADKFLSKAREILKSEVDSIRSNLEKDLTKTYTWRKNKSGLLPASAEQLIEFDRLADIIVEGGDLELKYKSDIKTGRRRASFSGYYTNTTLDAISAIYKAVRNRTGFSKQYPGPLNKVASAMQTYSERLKLFDDAKSKTEKIKKVPTDYAIEAKKMDQARTGDYWSEPHEMAARALSAYVEDKIAEQGNQSDFIVYHAHGGILLPMIDGFIARPYPEGAERIAINEAFDKFFKTIEAKETEKGVSLLRVEPALTAKPEGYKFTPKQAKNLIKTGQPIVGWLKKAGADQEVLDRITVDLKPFIDLRGRDIDKTIENWEKEGVDAGNILGASTVTNAQALIELATHGQNLASLERSTYHEWYHIAKKWVLPGSDIKALSNQFKTEEGEAEAFADYMKNTKTATGQPSLIKRIFLKLKRILTIIGNGLKAKGFTRAEDIFGKIRAGAYRPHFEGATGTQIGLAKRPYTETEKAWASKYAETALKLPPEEKAPASKPVQEYIKLVPKEEDKPAEPSHFEQQKDDWFGNKDWAVQVHSVEASKIQDAIKDRLGAKRYDDECKSVDHAIHIYLDLKRNPGHFDEYYNQLTPEQKKIVDIATNIERIPRLKEIADYIAGQYEKTGQMAKDYNIITNTIENYAARAWKQPKGKLGTDTMQKFKTTSRHAKHRVFETILEGWATKEMELEVTAVSNNLALLKDELSRTMEDKRLISKMRKTEWKNTGNMIITDKRLEGYKQIEHPNFTYWAPVATIKDVDIVKTYGKDFRVQENWGAIKAGKTRATKVFQTGEEAKLWVSQQEDAEMFRIAKRAYLWKRKPLYAPEELAIRLNNVLGTSKLKGITPVDIATKYNAVLKSTILMTSFFHHLAFMRSYLLGTRHKTMAQWDPFKAYKEGLEAIKELGPEIELLIRNGLTLGKMQDWEENILRSEDTIIGKVLDKSHYTKEFKDWVNKLRERQANFLFQNFGAGLKAQAALIEYKNALKEMPELESNERAKMVAELINDDFGGLPLQRIYGKTKHPKWINPTTWHIARLLLLAPDWTFSNVNTMWKAFRSGNEIEKTHLYRRFWASVATKGFTAVIVANFLLSLFDDDDFIERYKKAWKAGHFNWLNIDVTPIYKLLGGKSEARKYFGLFGHFRDPLKFMVHPIVSLKHKGSVIFRIIHEALTGTDWKGHRFTTLDELLGYDDKGIYLTETKEHKMGEPKGGKIAGETVTRRPGKEGPVGISKIPSYMISQLRGVMPIQVQNFLGWLQGEIEMFDAIGRSLGAHVSSTYPTEKSITKTFVDEYVDIKKEGRPFKDLRKKVDEYNERQELRGEEGIPVSWSTIVKKGLNIVKAERAGERRTAQ